MRVVGLDLSLTSTGVCITDGTARPETSLIKVNASGCRRMGLVRTHIMSMLRADPPDLVVVEGPSLHSRQSHFHESAGLWWIVVYSISLTDVPWTQIAPTVLKKYATGAGNADKIKMTVAAATRFNRPSIGSDEADALWLCAAAHQHYGTPIVQLPEAQRIYVDSVVKGRPVVKWPNLQFQPPTAHQETP